jgi:hypothetical protein
VPQARAVRARTRSDGTVEVAAGRGRTVAERTTVLASTRVREDGTAAAPIPTPPPVSVSASAAALSEARTPEVPVVAEGPAAGVAMVDGVSVLAAACRRPGALPDHVVEETGVGVDVPSGGTSERADVAALGVAAGAAARDAAETDPTEMDDKKAWARVARLPSLRRDGARAGEASSGGLASNGTGTGMNAGRTCGAGSGSSSGSGAGTGTGTGAGAGAGAGAGSASGAGVGAAEAPMAMPDKNERESTRRDGRVAAMIH